MSKKYLLLIFYLFLSTISLSAQQIIHDDKYIYRSNTLVVKVKNSTVISKLAKTMANYAVNNITELFHSQDLLTKSSDVNVLNSIYLIKYNTNKNPVELAAEISKISGVEWAEPKYIRRVCIIPNDSLYSLGKQENLSQIGAAQAWDITTGNKNIIIGIVDTGVDWTHPDLRANIYMVNDSLIPGSDIGDRDNDPSEDINPGGKYHGTHVAGIAGAVTDNSIGVASIGYNCSILPVKASSDKALDINGYPYITDGFEAIKWAADHGANVINCSWGGYGHSSYEQSIIDYAITKGALVVAAQGNDSSAARYYPANYDGVLSVGWLNTGIGVKNIRSNTNYGEHVKVFAPGSLIYSTWQRPDSSSAGIYKALYGSSQATPHVSGLAGLVWSEFPLYSPVQIMERIRVTSDYIDEYNPDSYSKLLGHGIINSFRAVDKNFNAISVRADSICFNGNSSDKKFFGPGEEIFLRANFTNYLASVDNITVTLTTADNYVIMENSTFDTGPLGTLTTISNKSAEFRFRVAVNTPHNHEIGFLLTFSDGAGYYDFQWTGIEIVDSYFTHTNNNITMTLTNKGTLGFNDYPYNTAGEGFKFKDSENLMYEGALMYGTSASCVMNEARITDRQKKNFIYDTPLRTYYFEEDYIADMSYSDSGAGAEALGITVNQLSRTLMTSPENDYIYIRSELENKTDHEIENLHAGYFVDWNIGVNTYETDTTYFDTTKNIAIAFNSTNSSTPYIAMALSSSQIKCGFYAIDNKAISGPVVISDADGFTDAEKWYTLSNGVEQLSAGMSDISYVISVGPYTIEAGQAVSVEFIIAGGITLQEALKSIQLGRIRYGGEKPDEDAPTTFKMYQNYPNPFNSNTVIIWQLPDGSQVNLSVYNILGQKVIELVNEYKPAGSYTVSFDGSNLASGIYFYRIQAGDFVQTKRMLLIK